MTNRGPGDRRWNVASIAGTPGLYSRSFDPSLVPVWCGPRFVRPALAAGQPQVAPLTERICFTVVTLTSFIFLTSFVVA